MWQISFLTALNCLGGMLVLNRLKRLLKRLKNASNGLFEVQKESAPPFNPLIKDKKLTINKPR